nr:hypothetical protein [Tanacetum cinerariifolium]
MSIILRIILISWENRRKSTRSVRSSKSFKLDLECKPNCDKMCCDIDNAGFGEDNDGVEDKDFESVTVNPWSFSVFEDTRVE